MKRTSTTWRVKSSTNSAWHGWSAQPCQALSSRCPTRNPIFSSKLSWRHLGPTAKRWCRSARCIRRNRMPVGLRGRGRSMDQTTRPMMARTENVPLGFLLGFVGVVIFGATLPATVVALGIYDPVFIAAFRAAFAGVLALVALLATGRRGLTGELPLTLTAGAMVTFGFPAFSSIAMETIPAGEGGVVLGILPLATAVFAALIARERANPAFWFWAIAGAGLVIWFVTGESLGQPGSQGVTIGHFWLFASAVAAALGYVIMARFSARMPGWEAICRVLVVCLPFNIALAAWLWREPYWSWHGEASWALGYHAVFSMFLGFFAWNAGLAIGGIARVGQIQLLQIFVTVGLSAWLLGETVTLRTLIFAVAVAFAVWMGRKCRIVRQPQRPH